MTGKRRVFVIELRRDGDEWRGRLRDTDADEVRADSREQVVRDSSGSRSRSSSSGSDDPTRPC